MSYEIAEGPTSSEGGRRLLEKRHKMEGELRAGKRLEGSGVGAAGVHLARAGEILLRRLGLLEKAKAEARSLLVTEQDYYLRRLPAEFDGLRVLHLSDLHCAVNREVIPRLAELVGCLDYDAMVLTGDYQDNIRVCEEEIIRGDMEMLLRKSKAPVFFTLGNHDHLLVANILENNGANNLTNQFARLRRAGAIVNFAGVDDPHYYQSSHMDMIRQISPDNFTLLLAHSPEVHHSPKLGTTDLVLCGHTHGGQICLPGGLPIITNSRGHRWSVSGKWKLGWTYGYTSRGVGTSGLRARLNCPPEITIHTLKRAR